MSRDVREFFDAHAAGYQGKPAGMRPFHRETASLLAGALDGEILAVGGLWIEADPAALPGRLTTTDLSPGMLFGYRDRCPRLAAADALRLPFPDGRFDHVVFPLVLHHIAGRGAREARRLVGEALDEARRVLKPGGRIWISELPTSSAVYLLQRLGAPLTRALLGAVGEPFVLFHSVAFYRRELERRGFEAATATRIRPDGISALDLVIPVIALPRLRVPRFLYPMRPTLLAAWKATT